MFNDFPKCVGCGYCCLAVQCFHSAKTYGSQPRCPALQWDDSQKRYICTDADFIEHLIGVGCPSNLNDWRKDVKFRG